MHYIILPAPDYIANIKYHTNYSSNWQLHLAVFPKAQCAKLTRYMLSTHIYVGKAILMHYLYCRCSHMPFSEYGIVKLASWRERCKGIYDSNWEINKREQRHICLIKPKLCHNCISLPQIRNTQAFAFFYSLRLFAPHCISQGNYQITIVVSSTPNLNNIVNYLSIFWILLCKMFSYVYRWQTFLLFWNK